MLGKPLRDHVWFGVEREALYEQHQTVCRSSRSLPATYDKLKVPRLGPSDQSQLTAINAGIAGGLGGAVSSEARDAVGLGKTKFYELIGAGAVALFDGRAERVSLGSGRHLERHIRDRTIFVARKVLADFSNPRLQFLRAFLR